MNDKAREMKLRRRCAKAGLIMKKSRAKESMYNFGEYLLLDLNLRGVVAGFKYDMTLDDIEDYLSES